MHGKRRRCRLMVLGRGAMRTRRGGLGRRRGATLDDIAVEGGMGTPANADVAAEANSRAMSGARIRVP